LVLVLVKGLITPTSDLSISISGVTSNATSFFLRVPIKKRNYIIISVCWNKDAISLLIDGKKVCEKLI
jgi:hypothetical protein